MRKPELLAPAKNLKCMKKVIEHGADSVYMGYSRFNARMFGKNFTVFEFKNGITYAHEKGIKVYLTLNTLIKDYELEDAIELARQAVKDGVDGILVQDLGLALAIRKKIPSALLHASTQMSVANHIGVKILRKLGFSRVVLSRELNSREIIQIKKIASNEYGDNMEIEAFIHGGLCIAYSGQCFTSSYCYSSSANRGMCKMPCWEKYVLMEDNDILESGTIIRPRDLSGLDELNELIKEGIDCLKIQGRLRSEEYISEIVDVYRNCIDTYKNDLMTEELFRWYEKRLSAISPRGLTNGNLSQRCSKDMIIKNVSYSEKIKAVSGKKCRCMEFSNGQQINNCEIPKDKKISVLLHHINEGESYLELTQEIDKVYIPFREFTRDSIKEELINICHRFDTFLYMPPMIYERNCNQYYNMVDEILKRYCLKGIILSNLSDIILLERYKDIDFISGNHIHVMNLLAIEMLKSMGIIKATLSLEMSSKEAISIAQKSDLPLEQIVYGHPELMHLKYCLYSKQNECGDCDACIVKSNRKKYLLKGKDNIFEIILFPGQTESILYNTKILSIPPNEWAGDSVRMDFLWETPQEINSVVLLMKTGNYYSGNGYVQSINID